MTSGQNVGNAKQTVELNSKEIVQQMTFCIVLVVLTIFWLFRVTGQLPISILQYEKKVASESLECKGFAVRLVDSIHCLADGRVNTFGNISEGIQITNYFISKNVLCSMSSLTSDYGKRLVTENYCVNILYLICT